MWRRGVIINGAQSAIMSARNNVGVAASSAYVTSSTTSENVINEILIAGVTRRQRLWHQRRGGYISENGGENHVFSPAGIRRLISNAARLAVINLNLVKISAAWPMLASVISAAAMAMWRLAGSSG
jgi:hypothetical protein